MPSDVSLSPKSQLYNSIVPSVSYDSEASNSIISPKYAISVVFIMGTGAELYEGERCCPVCSPSSKQPDNNVGNTSISIKITANFLFKYIPHFKSIIIFGTIIYKYLFTAVILSYLII